MSDTALSRIDEIVELTRRAGDPARSYAILGEGNTSLRTDEHRMLVKATGSSMSAATTGTFVEVDLPMYWDAIDGEADGDDAVRELFDRAKTWGEGRPSVESVLHAVCQRLDGVDAVVHTHPIPLLALLCSDRAEMLVEGSLFPDQIVVMGRHPLLVPYIDPGLPLARAVSSALEEHIGLHGERPRVIYLRNHGLFALAGSAEEALAITDMAVKCAEVLAGALAIGAPTTLSEEHAARIDTRPDEILRRSMLSR
ncbi:class II aldolase/adducin family protein [Leucobacter ruminantium]|uniref:Class II aldolase/adducin family protein n=1 Tax=Leucobacter ruminantium TaxID=1289170 RepID=A0A939RZ05_9MICO|nr:class II aldolase/adducin family protein [Leucobacter ruminantium]MBO1805386.1 class II aldolase/adducin family protein [Leucobacter ruminantium]